ncbi:hypothetical protein JMA_38650 (plasmid) [Jeotgalibacillus malaysiensis]|uniref:Uncharacterized protein n=1 Tax=Jeotgalibacillus malaysiensis TaxID=1508404 RepID=A0A0B5AX90_9BACL|nr:hypothetical protein [Jeotgalibacillus malaysiensis]AJD93183.1 hypothetical protein JMA_38650 [Jeotgalibacillus malaysiensis]
MKKMKMDVSKITRSVMNSYRKQSLPYQVKIEPFIKETYYKSYGVTISITFGDKKFEKRIRSIVNKRGLYLYCELKEENHGSYFKPDIRKRLFCTVKEMPNDRFFEVKMELFNVTNDMKHVPLLSKTPATRYFDNEYARDAFIEEVKPSIELFFQQHYRDYQGLVQEAEAPSIKEEANDKHLAGVEEAIDFLKDNPDLPQGLREPLEKKINQVRSKKSNEESVEQTQSREHEVEAIINALKLTHKIK